jgi:integrase/recombinase XerD
MLTTELQCQEFSQLAEGFKRELVKENKTESLISESTSYIKEILLYMEQKGITSLKKITQTEIDVYLKYLEQERINLRYGGLLSPKTINKHIGVITRFWKYMGAENITANPIFLRQPKQQPSPDPVVLSQKEIQWLYSVTDQSAIGIRDRAMLAIYYGTGMRKSEGLRLLLTDIDFNKGMIQVRMSKTNRGRYVMMSPAVQKQVEDYVYSARDFYLSEQATHQELFISERGQPIHAESISCRIEALWDRVKDRYGSDKHIGIHTLRHSIGTHLYMAGVEIEMVALMLGHRSLEATQLYIHLSQNLKQQSHD